MKKLSSLTALSSLLEKALKLIAKAKTKEAAPAKAAESAAAR